MEIIDATDLKSALENFLNKMDITVFRRIGDRENLGRWWSFLRSILLEVPVNFGLHVSE